MSIQEMLLKKKKKKKIHEMNTRKIIDLVIEKFTVKAEMVGHAKICKWILHK